MENRHPKHLMFQWPRRRNWQNRNGKKTLAFARNYLIQKDAARRLMNITIQMNFEEVEQRIMAEYLRTNTKLSTKKIHFAEMYGMKKAKCYPVESTNVTICNHNNNGMCSIFNKQCDNKQEAFKSAQVVYFSGSYVVDCPYCGKTNILSWERKIGQAMCEGKGSCHQPFKLIPVARDENEKKKEK